MPEPLKVSTKPLPTAFDYHINHRPNIPIESIFGSQGPGIFQQRAAALAIKLFVCIDYFLLLLLSQAGSCHTSFIDSPNPRWIMAADYQKRWNVMVNPGKSGRITPLANSYKLMQQNHTTEPNTRLNLTVPAYLNIVAHNNPVFKHAVMPDVYANHKKVIISYLRSFTSMDTRMYCNLLTNNIVVSDYESPYLVIDTQTKYLGRASDYAIGKQMVVFSNRDIFANYNIGVEHSTGTNRDCAVNNTIGPNRHPLS
jgi:hypothetical protein